MRAWLLPRLEMGGLPPNTIFTLREKATIRDGIGGPSHGIPPRHHGISYEVVSYKVAVLPVTTQMHHRSSRRVYHPPALFRDGGPLYRMDSFI